VPAALATAVGWFGWVATIGTVLRPGVRYARADDGVTIAYSVAGDGPVTIGYVLPLISQVELAWEEPALEHFWNRFAGCARVVLSGRRGAGLPDRSAAAERLDLAPLALNVKAVLDACDAGAEVLSGLAGGVAAGMWSSGLLAGSLGQFGVDGADVRQDRHAGRRVSSYQRQVCCQCAPGALQLAGCQPADIARAARMMGLASSSA
jgi:hypothetical protein